MKTIPVANNKIAINQSGMVSLVITMIMMIVITITVLGFSQIARREQRQTLDKQLSSQAYYAAESGVNAAMSVVNSRYLALGNAPPDKTSCREDNHPGEYDLFSGNANVIDSDTNTSYSCVLISAAPTTISYDISPTTSSKVIPIRSSGAIIDSLELSWTPSDEGVLNGPVGVCSDASKSLPSVGDWTCAYGVIRIDVVPITDLRRTGLLANTFTAFLAPDAVSTGPVTYAPGNGISSGTPVNPGVSVITANQGARPAASCDTRMCKVRIVGLPANSYFARISTLYRPTTLSITANSGASPVGLQGVQAVIDSTGRSQDVLRRIQVRVPLSSSDANLHNDYALETTNGICKLFFAYPGYNYNNPGDLEYCDR